MHNFNERSKAKQFVMAAGFLWLCGLVVWAGVVGSFIWVAYHFVSKFW